MLYPHISSNRLRDMGSDEFFWFISAQKMEAIYWPRRQGILNKLPIKNLSRKLDLRIIILILLLFFNRWKNLILLTEKALCLRIKIHAQTNITL
mgnify:CR=1 FL=1